MRGIARRARYSAILGAALALTAAVTACSSSGSSGGGSGTLKDALRHVHSTPQTNTYLEFGDTAALMKLNGGGLTVAGPFETMTGMGAPDLAQWSQMLPDLTGIDLNKVTSAISIGQPPTQVGILYGSFDPAAIGAKLAGIGYKKTDRGGGETAWTFRDNHEIDTSAIDPDTGIGPGMMGRLNVVRVSKSRIVYGGATADLDAAVPEKSAPLSGDSVVGPLADCLGSAVAAIVVTVPGSSGEEGLPPVAVGVTASSAADAREDICVAAPDAAAAQRFVSGFTTAVGSGTDFIMNEKWSQLLTDPKTEVLGGKAHVVRLSARPTADSRAQLIFDMVYQNDLPGLLGLPVHLKDRIVNPDGTVVPAPSGSPSS